MKTSILVGTPCYGGALHVNYFRSMLKLLPALAERGIECEVNTLAQESLISRARNTMVAEFLGRPDCTHLLFIDADIGFGVQAVQRLIEFDKPLVAAAYPMKGYDWDKMLAAAKTSADTAAMKRAALRFAMNVHDEDWPGDASRIEVVNGFARVSKAGTGMMLIRRDVFDAMRAKFPQLRYTNDVTGYDNGFTRGNFWSFFDTLVHPQTKRYMSEDYTFCHRWVAGCGGEVWLDLQSSLSHFGHAPYEGSFLAQATAT